MTTRTHSHRALTQREEKFCLVYVRTGNATQAYRESYKSDAMKDATIGRRAHDVLHKPVVVARIATLREQAANKASVTQAQVLDELRLHAFYDPAQLVAVKTPEDIARLPEAVRRAVIGWKFDRNGNVILQLSNKITALELLAKHMGMFVERKEIRVGELERLDDAALEARIAQAAAQVAQIEGVDVTALLAAADSPSAVLH